MSISPELGLIEMYLSRAETSDHAGLSIGENDMTEMQRVLSRPSLSKSTLPSALMMPKQNGTFSQLRMLIEILVRQMLVAAVAALVVAAVIS